MIWALIYLLLGSGAAYWVHTQAEKTLRPKIHCEPDDGMDRALLYGPSHLSVLIGLMTIQLLFGLLDLGTGVNFFFRLIIGVLSLMVVMSFLRKFRYHKPVGKKKR